MRLIARIVISLIGAAAFTLFCLLLLYTGQAIVVAKTWDATKPIVETALQPTRFTFLYIWQACLLGGPVLGFFLAWKYAFRPKKQG